MFVLRYCADAETCKWTSAFREMSLRIHWFRQDTWLEEVRQTRLLHDRWQMANRARDAKKKKGEWRLSLFATTIEDPTLYDALTNKAGTADGQQKP